MRRVHRWRRNRDGYTFYPMYFMRGLLRDVSRDLPARRDGRLAGWNRAGRHDGKYRRPGCFHARDSGSSSALRCLAWNSRHCSVVRNLRSAADSLSRLRARCGVRPRRRELRRCPPPARAAAARRIVRFGVDPVIRSHVSVVVVTDACLRSGRAEMDAAHPCASARWLRVR